MRMPLTLQVILRKQGRRAERRRRRRLRHRLQGRGAKHGPGRRLWEYLERSYMQEDVAGEANGEFLGKAQETFWKASASRYRREACRSG